VVLLARQGEIVGVIGQHGAVNSVLRRSRFEAVPNGKGPKFGLQVIEQNIRGWQEILLTFRKSSERGIALRKPDSALEELAALPEKFDDVRMIEARAALAYLTHWQELSLMWKGTGRRPIPEEWHHVGLRRGLLGGGNRNATHPANAILNYAYTILESQVRIAAAAEGFDPCIGYLHTQRPGRVALVYDLMEPLRPKADALVLDFLRSHVFAPADFTVDRRGVCRLHPQLARQVAGFEGSTTRTCEVAQMAKKVFIPSM
jgi:CRISPR-associated endonuclease Cas1